jgi:hypothetical protein
MAGETKQPESPTSGRAKWIEGIVLPALVGAIFGTVTSLATFTYHQAKTAENVQSAIGGEIQAILLSVRGPARRAAAAWEKNERLKDYKFYYPRAVFDGNTGHLGDIGDKRLVRDIGYLYAVLELARDEGRRLESNTSDQEGMLRYVSYLCLAFAHSMSLIQRMTGEEPRAIPSSSEEARRLNTRMLELDSKFLADINAKTYNALFNSSNSPSTQK